jgi:hypothetical protein
MKSGAYLLPLTSKRKASNEHRHNFSFSRKNHVVTELMLRKLIISEISQSCTAIQMDGWMVGRIACHGCLDGWMRE